MTESDDAFPIGEATNKGVPCDQSGCDYIAKNYLGKRIHLRFRHGIEGEGAKYRKQTEAKRRAMKAAKGMKQCPYCSFETWHNSSYKRHMNLVHPNETGYARIQNEPVKKTIEKKPEHIGLQDRIAELVATKIYDKLMS